MLVRVWDFLFNRKQWKIIARTKVFDSVQDELPIYHVYTLQDQFGNIKRKKIKN